jgi:hypothetical protein
VGAGLGAGAGAAGAAVACGGGTGWAANMRVYSPGPAEGAGEAGGVNSARAGPA